MRGRNTYFISIALVLYYLLSSVSAFSQQTGQDKIIGSHSFFAHITEGAKKIFLKVHADSIKPSDSAYAKINYPGTYSLKKNMDVFGWHVSWMGNAYRHYNYSLLTHIAYFGCDVDPTGKIRSFNGWDTSGFVSYVKSQNPQCKVLLTATCFGKSSDTLLQNPSAQASLIQQLYTSITEKKADGICIDFEGIATADKANFLTFITNLKLAFKKQQLMVSMTLPAVDEKKSFDLDALGKSVDLYILMGYDYFGAFSSYSGPVAPLKGKQGWISYNVETSVDYYLQNHVSPSSLILAVPYFGAIWETKDSIAPSLTTKFWGYRPYSYELTKLQYYRNDTAIQASYRYYFVSDSINNKVYRQFWMDGVYSLGAKYDYILQKKLAGVGIWALGFDGGSHDLWNLLRAKFSTQTLAAAVPTDGTTIDATPNLMMFITSRPAASTILVFLLLTTLLVVLLKVISSSVNVVKLKTSGLYYILLLTIFVIFYFNSALLLFVCFNLPVKTIGIILIAFTLVAFLFKIFKTSRNRDMP